MFSLVRIQLYYTEPAQATPNPASGDGPPGWLTQGKGPHCYDSDRSNIDAKGSHRSEWAPCR